MGRLAAAQRGGSASRSGRGIEVGARALRGGGRDIRTMTAVEVVVERLGSVGLVFAGWRLWGSTVSAAERGHIEGDRGSWAGWCMQLESAEEDRVWVV